MAPRSLGLPRVVLAKAVPMKAETTPPALAGVRRCGRRGGNAFAHISLGKLSVGDVAVAVLVDLLGKCRRCSLHGSSRRNRSCDPLD